MIDLIIENLDLLIQKILNIQNKEELTKIQNKLIFLFERCIKVVILIIIAYIVINIGFFVINKICSVSSKHMKSNIRKIATFRLILQNLFKYFVYFVLIYKVFAVFGEDLKPILTIASIGSVAIAFGSQSLVKDMILGAFILLEDQFLVGDVIKIGDVIGKVEQIKLRTLSIRTFRGELFIIPNGSITTITNLSNYYKKINILIEVYINNNLDFAVKFLKDSLKDFYGTTENVLLQPRIEEVKIVGPNKVAIEISLECKNGTIDDTEIYLKKYLQDSFIKQDIKIECLEGFYVN